MTFKKVWRVLRIVLFLIWVILLGLSILPSVVLVMSGYFWLIALQFGSFIPAFYIGHLEQKAGWADSFNSWIED